MEKLLRVALGLIVCGVIIDGYFVISNFTKSSQSYVPEKHTKLNGIVRLTTEGKTFCSGTVISRTTVLTAAHCVRAQIGPIEITRQNIEIRPISNTDLHISGEVYSVRPQLDQALLRGDFDKFDPRPYIVDIKMLDSLRHGTYISCGFPMGGGLFCTKLIYKELMDFFWSVDGLILPGMSGGPVFADSGEVIAVNNAVENNDSFISPIYNLEVDAQ